MKQHATLLAITITVVLALLFITLNYSACAKKSASAQAPVKNIKQEKELHKGSPYTIKTIKKISGITKAKRIDDTTGSMYKGTITNDALDLEFIAELSADSSSLLLRYEGSLPERIIAQTDTLIRQTITTLYADTPWYATFEAGVASCGIILLLYLLISSTF